MPNINLTEKDMSTFADQQFIRVMYNGNTNSLPKSGSTDLDFTVKFMVENALYQVIYVGENQKVSAPVNVPVKEGYEFKNWQLNGEAFDFSTVITSDILLIAEFEEAGEEVIWEDTLDFISIEEEMPGWIVFNGLEAFPELDKLNTTDTFTFSIPELNKSVTGKFTKVSEEDDAYIIGEEDGIVLQANTRFYVVAVEGEAGTYTVKLTKSAEPAPSGYTWNGMDTSEKDVELDGIYAHYVNTAPSEMAADYIGATLVYKLGDTETPYVLSEEDIEDMSEGGNVAIAISILDQDPVAMVFKNYDGFDDGLYFLRDDEESSAAYGGYTTSLTLAAPAPSETVIIPTSTYETEDTGYGDGYLEFTDMEPPVIDDTVFGEYINEVDAAVDGGTLESMKHTITVGAETLTNQVLKSDARLGITYFGNVSLYDESGEDTGEEWFLGVSSTLAFTTKTPTTINFGLSYKLVQ